MKRLNPTPELAECLILRRLAFFRSAFCSLFRILIFVFIVPVTALATSDFVFPKNFPQALKKQQKAAFTKQEILDFWYDASQYFIDEGDFSNAIKAAEELKVYALQYKEPRFEAGAYEVMGQAYDYLGQLSLAVNYHLKALNIREKLGRKIPIAFSLSQMGDIYSQLDSYLKAEDYFKKALKLFRESGYSFEVAELEYNLATIYSKLNRNADALLLHKSSLVGFASAQYQVGIATAYSAIGTDFLNLLELDSALYYQLLSLKLREQIGQVLEISLSYSDLCLTYTKAKRYKQALKYGLKALRLNKKLGIPERLLIDYGNLSEVFDSIGDYKQAYYFLFLEKKLSDSLSSQSIQEEIANQSIGFELQKIRYLDSLKKAEDERLQKEQEKLELEAGNRQARLQYLGIFIFISLLLGTVFLIRRISLPVIWLEGGIFFTALLLFEFLYLILDPWVEEVSDGTPVYKFGINLVLGLMVFYAHNLLEVNLKRRLIRPQNSANAELREGE